jgi:putative tryptophan/tyrosine transport system substrate-binding protein
MGRPIRILNASNQTEIEAAFAMLLQIHADAVLVASDPFFTSRRNQIVALAARHAIPAIYEFRHFAVAGGLLDELRDECT